MLILRCDDDRCALSTGPVRCLELAIIPPMVLRQEEFGGQILLVFARDDTTEKFMPFPLTSVGKFGAAMTSADNRSLPKIEPKIEVKIEHNDEHDTVKHNDEA